MKNYISIFFYRYIILHSRIPQNSPIFPKKRFIIRLFSPFAVYLGNVFLNNISVFIYYIVIFIYKLIFRILDFPDNRGLYLTRCRARHLDIHIAGAIAL